MLSIDVEGEFSTERLQIATEYLKAAVREDPGNRRYRKTLAEAYLAARHNENAAELLSVLVNERSDPRVLYLAALAQFRCNRFRESEELLRQVPQDGTVGFARLHLLRGRIHYGMRRFNDAVNEFVHAQTVNGNHKDALWWEARALVAAAGTRVDDAAALYRRALKILFPFTPRHRDKDEWNFLLGRVYLALRYPAEALKHLEVTRARAEPERQLLLGLTLLLNGRVDSGISCLAVAAETEEGRRRTEAYLCELGLGAPSLIRMAGSPVFNPGAVHVTDELLSRVFGPFSREAERIRKVVWAPQRSSIARTVVEGAMPVVVEPLFADVSEPAPATLPHEVVETQRAVRSPSDRIFQRTLLDVAEVPTVLHATDDAPEDSETRLSKPHDDAGARRKEGGP